MMKEMPINNVEWVDVETLSGNDYNPNVVMTKEMNLLKLSILKNGWIQPILVTQEGVIIDGFHRATLCKMDKKVASLTGGRVPVVVMNLTEPERMLLTIRINRAKGSHIAFRMADVMKVLVREYQVPIEEIVKEIGASKDEVELLLQDDVFTMKGIDEHSKYSKAWVPE